VDHFFTVATNFTIYTTLRLAQTMLDYTSIAAADISIIR